MDTPITRAEHEEFRRRLEEENRRQDKRISLIEDNVREMANLTTSVEKLATNMENMLKEQEKQGKRLEILENRDGEMWRKIVAHALTAFVGLACGVIFSQMGIH